MFMETAFSKQLEANNMTVDKGSVICEKCHKLLISNCDVKCIICGNISKRSIHMCLIEENTRKL